ncbi:stage II sporulation protein M [Salipaludibacillus keqinensis]|jgi:stage II sporulation protein M|uniref:Stage II sporulation protein M n=1 Tax=Salipaludibacillus keqinensis TaxID=2045207 RepID=A0A323THW1_9BACI|nr:stage II sporulation protein M [Salipaludibacillus keqinensis]PYZ94428.1 stage II sporulation protein M [Salipaludibacillus keqinensis]
MSKPHFKRNKLLNHLEDHRAGYIFTSVLLIVGVIFGAIIVNSMSFTQKNDLYAYLTLFFNEVEKGEFAHSKEIFTQSFAYYSKMLGFIWILGLSVIGLPVVFILVFIKGLMVGFTVGFLVDQMGFEGFLFAFSAVFPQNILLIPMFIIVASTATSFSILIWRQVIRRSHQPIFPHFLSYTVFILLIGGLLVIVSAFEAFVTPVVMQFVVEKMI